MAKRENTTSKLTLKIVVGQTETGKDKYGQCTLKNLNPAVTDEQLFALGNKLGSLQECTVAAVIRQDANEIVAD